ncbi:aminotransferase class III-fold pyridoxal phosphate-dependent enzyme [Bacillus anthracis]|uniref:aspartate aminotransferase family protein n=1 Tax=Bacillus cereus group TaxID=86661 RepID=UPI00019FFEE5|nr:MULTISPECIES: aminotransferase class III-fold pyridoxal phosphate-dependent enzyme [Bacillus cereus group]EEK55798.1 Succinylornithine transaminase [Bacillus cereus BGSC 6E1]MCU5690451.1 aminotransferase class III-fold pyridoxal phosphate-dependent enzyme [Bacillus cereus]MEB9907177.1 aminotransferase class III-fold pyridoxal phosphate-dependent enzyme [Bacillus anthracis]MEC1955154.1 aminotransferase class III-fold pyridoxal phosphate-dependent enzyme [Bacillus anthracis]
MSDWFQLDKEYMMSTYCRTKIAIERGEGCKLYDVDGKEYLDLFSGVGVNVLGYNHPKIVQTTMDQVTKSLHLPFHFLNPVAIEYAKKLVDCSLKNGKVFFTNSGTEATETTLKLIDKYRAITNEEREGIVVLKNSFHGRTLGALHFTRQESVYQNFPTTSIPVYEVERENIEQLEETIINENPIAILLEPVLGSGGIYPLSREYLHGVQNLCDKYNVIFIVDEVQSGMGRTGKLFAYQNFNITPHIIQIGKGAGGGIPLGGIIVSEKLCDVFAPGDHGTTFAHSSMGTALGLTVLNTLLDDGLMQEAYEMSLYLNDKLQEIQKENSYYIEEVRHAGMMFGISLNDTNENVKKLQVELMEKGILVDVTQGNIIRLLPPYIITKEEIDTFITQFIFCMDKVAAVVSA